MNELMPYIPKGRISKQKLSRMYDFSPSDLRRFLNNEIFEKIGPLGYKKSSKYVSAKIVAFIITELGDPKQ